MTISVFETIPLLREALVMRFKFAGHLVNEFPTNEISNLDATLRCNSTDLLWMDSTLIKDTKGNMIKAICKGAPSIKVLLFGNGETLPEIKSYFLQGINCYLPKTTAREEIDKALSKIISEGIYIPLELHQKFDNWITSRGVKKATNELSIREKEVLQLIVEENTTGEIAKKLFLGHCTIETHRINLIHKLGVKNTAGLVRVALETGLYV